ncbi:carbamate kinase [Alkaliphilus sp. B6464]|uniref:carbamate kinase n=1 Tax=Alkaliphilus sp. B6464 TaxID=2731219 RepID=UPI001BAA6441|nr:carbamate kinase [Alkaliphilus sp. B6464]QUH18847.1 carbamate kinase [Alkaliphilus sp. B6464]
MMNKKKKIVIALGGNALGNNLEEQKMAVKTTAIAIVDLIEEGCDVVIAHGNGPQVGMIHSAMSSISSIPLYVSGAMSQTYIGLDLENALRDELLNRGIKDMPVATVMTQVVVDKEDKSFENPTKPIGRFMSLEEANLAKQEHGYDIVEDSGRGYRRVVPSPSPKKIVEIDSINTLVERGQLVICCGGGGIPVIQEGNSLIGVEAVIDKDFVSCLLAKELDADFLIILTAVEKVAINFGKENEKWLSDLNIEEAKGYIEEGHFAPGSMLPKIEAALDFAGSKEGRAALITQLEKAKEGINGETGTRIHM